MNHFIHYLRRDIVNKKHTEITNSSGADISEPHFYVTRGQTPTEFIYYPGYHITKSTYGPASRIRQGDVIWVVAQLYSSWGGKKLPPGLDMKIIVESITLENVDGRSQLRFKAAKGSMWFPYKNASTVLQTLDTLDRNNNVLPLWKNKEKNIGYYLQSIRQLKDGTSIQEWASRISSGPFYFISYRIKDGTSLAWYQVEELIKAEEALFWDRWSLPRSLVERLEFANDRILTEFLQQQIKCCSKVISIQTDLYGAPGSYSAIEKEFAITLGKLKS